MNKGTILGIDYGRARIGLSISEGILASPIKYILNKGNAKNLAVFKELQQKYKYNSILLGVPLHIDGGETAMSREIRAFGEYLGNGLGVEVVYHNERYSSKEAEEHIRNNLGIKNPKKIAELVDSMAATMVLSQYLQHCENEKLIIKNEELR